MLSSPRWALAFVVFCLLSASSRAEFTFASDVASNYGGSGEPSWTNGSSGGFGFGNWSLTTTSGAAASIADPDSGGIAGLGAESFALSTTSTNTGTEAKAARSLSSAMLVGDTFSFAWGINQTAGGAGSKGFNVVSGGTSLVAVTETNGVISLNGTATGLAAGTNAMTWAFHYSNASTLAVSATHAGGSGFSTNVTVGGAVTGFSWDAIQLPSGATHQSYYNNLLVTNSGVYAVTETEGRALTGTGALVVSNNSTLTLTSNGNTFTGGTTIQSGSALHVGNGGSAGVLPGAVANSGALVFNRSSTLSYGGVISGSGSVTKTGTGSLTLSGNNSFGGVLTVTEGKLTVGTINNANQDGVLGHSANAVVLGASGGQEGFLHYVGTADASSTKNFTAATGGTAGLEVSNSATTLTLSGVIGGAGNVTKGGAGILLLSGVNTFTGALSIHAGTIEIGSINNNGANGVLGNNSHAVGLGKSGTGNNATLRYNGATSAASNKAFTLDSNEGGAGIIQIDNSAVDLSLSGAFSGVGNLTKTGAGTLTLSGNNSFSGVLTVAEGKLTINTINNASANGTLGNSSHAVVLGSSGQTGFLHYTGGKIGSTKRFTAAAGGTAGIEVSNAATVLTLAGVIDGSGDVQKGGAGTLLLDAVNTFTGALNVHEGTVEVEVINNNSQNGTLGNSTHAVGLGKTNTSNTATLLYAGPTSGSTTKGFALNSLTNGAGVINVSSNTVALAVSGAVTGAGRLEKAGAGTLVLSASNNYTGGTTLTAGVLQLDSIHAAGTGKITQTSGSSTLQIDTTGTIANQMSIYNIRTMQNVTLTGAKTLNNTTYTVDPNVTTTEAGNLDGTGGVTKQGTGTLILTGNNTYTGAVAVNAGVLNLNSGTGGAAASAVSVSVASGATLLISHSNQVNNDAAVSLSGGTIQRASGVTETFGALTLAAASTLNFGTGTANSLNFGTYAGGGSKLNVTNFLQGNVLTFKTDLSGSINNTSLFGFDNGFSSNWNSGTSTFTITAIPEPSTYVAAAGLLAMFLWPVRRRMIKDLKSILGLRPTGRERIEAYRNA
jgi:fibronectin-binding autotransporter adhesin